MAGMLMSFEGVTRRAFVADSIEVIGGPLLEKKEKAQIDALERARRSFRAL